MKKSRSTTRPKSKDSTKAFFQRKTEGHFFSGNALQSKLKVGSPKDPFEQQADQVATQVIGKQAPSKPAVEQITPLPSNFGTTQNKEELQTAKEESSQVKSEDVQNKSEDVQNKSEDSIQQKETIQQLVEEPAQAKQDNLQTFKEDTAQAKSEDVQFMSEDSIQQKEAIQQLAKELTQVKQDNLQTFKEDTAQAKSEDVQFMSEDSIQQKEAIQQLAEEPTQVKQDNLHTFKEDTTQAKSEDVQSMSEDSIQQKEVIQQLAEEPTQVKQDNLQTQAITKQDFHTNEFIAKLNATKGQGSQLKDSIQLSMEEGFGVDFSGVRIHTDSAAVKLSKSLKAKAFTHGKDIYFNEGNFSPETQAGQFLLAHELTHTIQQGAVKAKSWIDDFNAPFSFLQSKEEAPIQTKSEESDTIKVRPEIIAAINLARTQIDKVNSKLADQDGNRTGWLRLKEYFDTAFGGVPPIHESVIQKIVKVDGKEALPSWCGIFVWWAFKKSGIPLPNWKVGKNILKDFKTRGPKELPQKGDIAFNMPKNQHFGFVTGVESVADAKGKPYNSVRVTTMNGNTAGNDNLGGQIQEQTHTIGHWLGSSGSAFIIPFSGLDMPEVELVATTRSAKIETPTANDNKEAEAPLVEKPSTLEQDRIANLDGEELTSALPMPEEATQVDMTLPPAPEAGPAEEVAEVQQADLSGKSEEAMLSFINSSASSIAVTQPVLGGELTKKLGSEQQQAAKDAPTLVAKTKNKVEDDFTSPDQIPLPDANINSGNTEADPGEKTATPHVDKTPVPSAKQFDKTIDEAERKQGGGFFDWLKQNMQDFLYKIPESDNQIKTSAGKRPKVDLTGDANPEKMKAQRAEANTALTNQRDTTTKTLKNHPGQKNIQPQAVNEEKSINLSLETKVNIQTNEDTGMADYTAVPLPADVRKKSDLLLQPKLATSLANTKNKTTQAAKDRDTNRDQEIQKAKTEVDKSNQKADEDQKNIVVENRNKVAAQQKKGIEEAYQEVNNFNSQADTKHNAAKKEIKTEIQTKESAASKELEKGEEKAKGIKEKGEKDAKAKKEELKKKQKKKSWWDKVKSAVKSVVKAITSAIDGIFKWVREKVKAAIEFAKNAAIGLINKARNFIKDKLEKFRTWAKDMTNKYLKDKFPGLAARINSGIDAVVDVAKAGVDAVADAAIATVEFIADNLTKALDKILEVFQTALKAAVQIAGAVLTGDFAEALRIAIQAACDIAGIDSKIIFDFIDKAKSQIMKILKNPSTFFKNLVKAVGGGVRSFFKNIATHLKKGLIEWLTGSLTDGGLTLPDKFDLKGIIFLVMQVLGLTYENIKAQVIKKLPGAEKVFGAIEKGVEIVKKIAKEGISGIWKEVKAKIGNFKEMLMNGIKEFVMGTVIKEGITWLLSLLNPASAIVKALKLIIDFIFFLIENFQRIVDFVKSVYQSLANIAAGNISPAIKYIESTLARILPIAVSLLANLAGLRGIAKTIKKIMKKISKPINKLIRKIVDKMVKFGRKLLGKGKKFAKKVVGKITRLFTKKTRLNIGGESHSLFFKKKGKSIKLIVASDPKSIEGFISYYEQNNKLNKTQENHIKKIRSILAKEVNPEIKKLKTAEKQNNKKQINKSENILLGVNDKISNHLKNLLKNDPNIGSLIESYLLEGTVGRYSSLPNPSGDLLDKDHQPQKSLFVWAAQQRYFGKTSKMATHAANDASKGYAINLYETRHKAGRTYKDKGKKTLADFKAKATKQVKSKETFEEKRNLVVNLIKSELKKDVSAMKKVVRNQNNLKDLNELPEKDRKRIKSSVKRNIISGENKLAAQNLDDLKN